MADTGLLNGAVTEFAECGVTFAAGTDGATANVSFFAGIHLKPKKKDKLEISLDGVNFTGIVDDCTTSYEGLSKKYDVSVIGPQQLLDGDCSNSLDGTVQEIAERLVDGTGIGVTVLGDIELATYSFPFAGTLKDAIDNLQSATGFFAWLAPNAVLYLIHRQNGFTPHPHPWTPSQTGYRLTSCKYLPGIPKTVFRAHGKNAKTNIGDPDSELTEYKEAGDGTKTEFSYDATWTEVTRVDLDGVQTTFAEAGSVAAETSDAVNYPDRHTVIFTAAPGSGVEVKLSGVKQFASSEIVDEATRAELAAKFGGTGRHPVEENHPELTTQQQADQYAEGLQARYGGVKQEASAEVWAEVPIYTPIYTVALDDGDGFAGTLPVQQNSLKREASKWIQTPTIGNGREGGSGSGAGAVRNLASRVRRATLPPQPPAPTTTVEYSGPPVGPPWLSNVRSIGFDTAGNAYIADTGNQRIRKVSTGGILSTIAGDGTAGNSGDGGTAAAATLNLGWTGNQVFKSDGTSKLYLSGSNDTVRMIDLGSGLISRFAGTGTEGNSGDGGPATSAEITNPMIVSGISSLVYFQATTTVSALKKVTAGTIDTFVEGGNEARDCQLVGTDLFVVENGSGEFVVYDSLATRTVLATLPTFSCYGCATDGTNWYVSDPTVSKIYKLDGAFSVTDFAGTTAGYSGDGGAATSAQLNGPHGMAVFDGFLYIADENNYCIRRINLTTGIISLFAGTPETSGFSGDGGPAT